MRTRFRARGRWVVTVLLAAAAALGIYGSLLPRIRAERRLRNRALVTAVRAGDAERCRVLLRRGAEPDSRDPRGAPALLLAAAAGRTDLVRLLLDRGARTDARDREGSTALLRAALAGQAEIVGSLAGAGADLNAKDSSGNAPLTLTTAVAIT